MRSLGRFGVAVGLFSMLFVAACSAPSRAAPGVGSTVAPGVGSTVAPGVGSTVASSLPSTVASMPGSTTVPSTQASVFTPAVTVSSTSAPTTLPPNDLTKDRPYDVFVPSTYDAKSPIPLVILLHGYSFFGAGQEAYLKLQPLAESRGFLYVHPDGTAGPNKAEFWNASDACCNFFESSVDDSGYLNAVVEQIQAKYNVDPKRIFFVGHSNGGFMSHRMACDHADKVAAIVSLAGAMPTDLTACRPAQPVSVLQIHGDNDQTIKYSGGSLVGHSYPSAATTVADWAKLNGCSVISEPGVAPFDLERSILGPESTSLSFGNCRPGGAAELWTIAGGSHLPAISDTFSSSVIDFLFAHPKP